MLEIIELFLSEIIVIAGVLILVLGVMRIIKLFARYSRYINP